MLDQTEEEIVYKKINLNNKAKNILTPSNMQGIRLPAGVTLKRILPKFTNVKPTPIAQRSGFSQSVSLKSQKNSNDQNQSIHATTDDYLEIEETSIQESDHLSSFERY